MKKEDIEKIRSEVTTELDLLVKAYGFPAIRAAANRYFKLALSRRKAKAEIAALEKRLEALRGVV